MGVDKQLAQTLILKTTIKVIEYWTKINANKETWTLKDQWETDLTAP